ncbi:LysR family transcriptional regulator [Streptomyces niveus]|uniref:LysR family transcriptional regulator n=1 Tax=Streptomyces niveus TaxID=193462 RepID=UPI00342A76A8
MRAAARTLPLRSVPHDGEALDSWLEVIAAQLRVPIGEVLVALGLREEGVQPLGWAPWMTLLLPGEADHLAHATGIERERLHAMTLAHFDDRALVVDHARRRVNRSLAWGRSAGSGSRFCPECLGENGGRRPLHWRLGWSFACLAHRRLLVDFCPRCGSRQRLRPYPSQLIPRPGLCDYVGSPPHDGSPRFHCLHPLAEAKSMVLDAGHPALLAQQDLLEAIAQGTGTFGVYAHDPQRALSVLADMKGIARRVLFHMPPHRMSRLVPDELVQAHLLAREHNSSLSSAKRRAPIDPGRAAPAYVATAAVGATAAWNVLGQADCRQAGPRMRELHDAIVERGYWASATVTRAWGRHTSPVLESVHLTAVAPTLWPNAALRYRTALPAPSMPTSTPSQVAARARKIPGVVWPLWAVRLNPHPQVRDHLAAALAASLLLVNSRIELSAAVKKLGSLIDQPILTHTLQALRDDACYEGIQLALIRLAAYVDSHDVPIDYGRRRRLDYTGLLRLEEWREVWDRSLLPPAAANQRFEPARCFLFERISGLPYPQMPDPPNNSLSLRTRWRRFPLLLTRGLIDGLDQIGRAFLARHGIHDEPVFWQPPASLLDGLDLPRPDPAHLDIDTLHQLVGGGQSPLPIAQALGTDLRSLRYAAAQYPLPTPDLSAEAIRARASGSVNRSVPLAREILPKARFEQLYVGEDRPFTEIARATGVCRKTLAVLADEYGIPRRRATQRKKLDKQWLHEQYVVRGRTLTDIGRESGMSGAAVAARARDHGIPVCNNRQPRGARYDFASAPAVIQPSLNNTYAIRRLRIFLQVVRYPTLGEACRTHGISPGTLTQQLQRLETDLGGPLLIRAGRGRPLELTHLGKEVVRAVEDWTHTLVDQPRETWHQSAPRPSPATRTGRTVRARHMDDAPNAECFPALLQPAVRTYAGQRRLHHFLQAAAYPTLAAFCREAEIRPSTLTPQLQHLEQDLQGQLLVRGQRGHRMRLTDFGERVLTAALPYADQLRARDSHRLKDEDRQAPLAASVRAAAP